MAARPPGIIGNAAIRPEEQVQERPPIDFEHINGERPLLDKHTFKLSYGSEMTLRTIGPNGKKPARQFWDADKKLSEKIGYTTFKLTTAKLPKLEDKSLKLKKLDEQSSLGGDAASVASGGEGPLASPKHVGTASQTSLGSLMRGEKPQKRADLYFDLLMKAHNKREEEDAKLAEQEEWARAEGAAQMAVDKIVVAENPPPVKEKGSDISDSSDEDSEMEEEEPPDYGDLTAYDGQMKIEIDFVVVKAPGEQSPGSSEVADGDHESTATPAASDGTASTPPMDFEDELEALKEELKGVGGDEPETGEGDDDGLPEGLKGIKKMPNIWDNPFPEWSLDLGGSVFFVPEAERYSIAPSLPPPPPPSLLGRRRIRLKPRLPLDISNHRYRDEHPNIWPTAPFSPEQEHYASFEQKMLTFDLYRSCCESLTMLPPQEFAKDGPKHRYMFGRAVENALGRSQAWKNWRHREKVKRQKEEAARQAAVAEEMRKKAEKEEKIKAAEEAARAAEEEDD